MTDQSRTIKVSRRQVLAGLGTGAMGLLTATALADRPLSEISQERFHDVKIYLAKLPGFTAVRATDANPFGVPVFPEENATRSDYAVCRFLGTDKDSLDCDSTILIATWKPLTDEQIECQGDDVYSLTLKYDDKVPYAEIEYGSSVLEPKGERMYLTVSNHTQSDLWVEWFRDVHEDHHMDFVRNNRQKERKTRKVGLGGASVPLKFYRNSGGEPGKYLGATTAKIAWHLAGREHLELVREGNRCHVVSLIQFPGTVLAVILL